MNHPSPWASEPDGYLPARRLQDHLGPVLPIAEALGVEPRSVQRYRETGRLWTAAQAFHAARLCGVDPYEVWPELDTNVPAPPPGWHERAVCVTESPDLFHPEPTRWDPEPLHAAALAVCGRCPVWWPCLLDKLRTEPSSGRHGVAGRATPLQRARVANLLGYRPRVLPDPVVRVA